MQFLRGFKQFMRLVSFPWGALVDSISQFTPSAVAETMNVCVAYELILCGTLNYHMSQK